MELLLENEVSNHRKDDGVTNKNMQPQRTEQQKSDRGHHAPTKTRKVPTLSRERIALHTAMCNSPASGLSALVARWS
jgi:hypothetical protein